MAIPASNWLLMCRNCSWRLGCLISLPIAMNSKGTVQFIAGLIEHRSHGKHSEFFLHLRKMDYLLSRAMLISDTLIVVRVWQLMNKPLKQQVIRTVSCSLPTLTGLTLLNSNRSVLEDAAAAKPMSVQSLHLGNFWISPKWTRRAAKYLPSLTSLQLQDCTVDHFARNHWEEYSSLSTLK